MHKHIIIVVKWSFLVQGRNFHNRPRGLEYPFHTLQILCSVAHLIRIISMWRGGGGGDSLNLFFVLLCSRPSPEWVTGSQCTEWCGSSNICSKFCLLYQSCQAMAPLSLYLPHKLRQKNCIMRNCSSPGLSSTPSHHPAHQRPVTEKIVKETFLGC